jgi:hypothetical protein
MIIVCGAEAQAQAGKNGDGAMMAYNCDQELALEQ